MRNLFQRRHYQAVADAIKKSPIYTGGDHYQTQLSVQQMQMLIERFVTMFEADNPRFDADRFRNAACGAEPAYEITIEGKAELLRNGAA